MAYTATYNRPQLVRGDTLQGWSITATDADDQPVSIESARCQLRTTRDVLLHEFDVIVTGNTVAIGQVLPEVTATWTPATYEFDVEFTLTGGRVVTWLKGAQAVVADRTR